MKSIQFLSIVLAALINVVTTSAQTIVYDSLTTGATAGYSEANANSPIFGDGLTLSQGGVMSWVGLSLFNSTSGGNTGSILTGTMAIKFYDNTIPYAGGVLSNPLLGTATVSWDFTADGGLPAGYYVTDAFNITGLNIAVPQDIFVTQQFTLTSGTSTRNGVILFSDPVVGSSPDTVYIKSATTPEDLYTFSGNPGQFGYYLEVQVVPEPSTVALLGLALAGAVLFGHRRQG